jgi:hypothetical protein
MSHLYIFRLTLLRSAAFIVFYFIFYQHFAPIGADNSRRAAGYW